MSPTDDTPERSKANKGAGKPPESLLDLLNRSRPEFQDEALAPPVDRGLLGKLVRNELSEVRATEVYRLVISFRSWDEAHTEILTEFHRQSSAKDDEPDAK